MKKLFFLILTIFLYADEVQLYSGKLDVDGKNGVYTGGIYEGKSEDETLKFKLGFKKINLYDKDVTQNETFISIKKETDLDKHIEFAFQDIHNQLNNASIYIFNWYKSDEVDYKIGGSFSNYDKNNIYQMNFQLSKFLGQTPFYITPTLYGVDVVDDKFYQAFNFKFGYIEGKNDIYGALLIGKNRYLVTDDNYYSCNFGYTTKYAYKLSYAYQLNLHLIVKLSYYYYKLEEIDNIKAGNLAFSYKY